ncbi:hypothetical protein L0B52_04435 [Suttonella sp. R2A3]|uniref:YncE family protein n=1 Tax=Suttonella sp. R2A3 TaxID=2908648 RepID=UPI001F3C6DA0|nr:hypothetical protein [Suttonella sp. R2A3]UJF25400.1 hypothetical protein L0B52_04435 [Suttonella sp. R2A3]
MKHKQKKTTLLIAALFGFIALAAAWFFLRDVTPDQVMSELFDLNAPTRFAFVSEAEEKTVTVVDVIQGQSIGQLALDATPDFWALSAASGQLIYAPQGSKQVYFYDTTTHESQQQTLDMAVEHWQYHDGDRRLFYADQQSVAVLDMVDKRIERIPEPLNDIKTIFYDGFAQVLWVLDKGSPSLVAWSMDDNLQTAYPLPEDWQDFSPLAITPDGRYLIFAAANQQGIYQAVFWSLSERQVAATVGQWTSPILQPYVDSNGRYAWLFSEEGKGLRVAVDDLSDVVDVPQTGQSLSVVASGWLDQRLLLAGKSLDLQSSKDFQTIDQQTLPGTVQTVFITADSKTALLTVHGEAALYAYGLRDGTLKRLELPYIDAADKVIMGASNTLCH